MRLLVLTTLALAMSAAPAAGATATVTTTGGGDEPRIVIADLVAAAGERNDVEARLTATDVTFRDTGTRPSAGQGCVAALDAVRCPLSPGTEGDLSILIVRVRAGDGDDRVRLVRPTGAPQNHLIVLTIADGGDGADDLAADTAAHSPDPRPPIVIAVLDAGAGDDTVAGGEGGDQLAGGAGRDSLRGGGGDDMLGGDTEGIADAFVNAYTHETASEQPQRRPPPDTPTDDAIDGGAGEDTTFYGGRQIPVKVDLSDLAPDGSSGEGDTLAAIENVVGGEGDNDLLGDGGPNRLVGGDRGTDRLVGGAGDDELVGLKGANVLDGGTGDDVLEDPSGRSRCGGGRDSVGGSKVDGVALRRDCELLRFGFLGSAAAIKLRPLRRTRGHLVFDGLAYESLTRNDRKVKITVSRPGGGTLASDTVTLPEGTEAGRSVVLRVALGARGRRGVSRLRRVRVTLSSVGSKTVVDLPVARR